MHGYLTLIFPGQHREHRSYDGSGQTVRYQQHGDCNKIKSNYSLCVYLGECGYMGASVKVYVFSRRCGCTWVWVRLSQFRFANNDVWVRAFTWMCGRGREKLTVTGCGCETTDVWVWLWDYGVWVRELWRASVGVCMRVCACECESAHVWVKIGCRCAHAGLKL